MAKTASLEARGESVGAPFSAWRINPDFTVKGVTLYANNNGAKHISAKQAFTARGASVWADTKNADYFTEQWQALQAAHRRAQSAREAARVAFAQATSQERAAHEALLKHLAR
jgi:hypothetical protein